MSAPSLREIERTLATLWLDGDARQDFLKAGRDDVPQSLRTEIDKKGVKLYASLLNHGRQDLMRSIYPHCARLLGKNWQPVVTEYFAAYPPDHYNLNRAALHFAQFLKEHGQDFAKRFPFLVELADYEWLEMQLLEIDVPVVVEKSVELDSPEAFSDYGPLVNPVMTVKEYQYPICKIVDQLANSKRLPRNVSVAPTFVAVYRDPETNKCRFMELGAVASAVIDAARQGAVSFADLVSLAVSKTPQVDPQIVVSDFLKLMETLQEMRVFIGSKALAGNK